MERLWAEEAPLGAAQTEPATPRAKLERMPANLKMMHPKLAMRPKLELGPANLEMGRRLPASRIRYAADRPAHSPPRSDRPAPRSGCADETRGPRSRALPRATRPGRMADRPVKS